MCPIYRNIVYSLFVALFLLSSCASRKNLVYFYNENKSNKADSTLTYIPTIKPDDLLSIIISSIELDASKPFNQPVYSYTYDGKNIGGTPTMQGYLVDAEGMIEFPVIGKIKLGGLTKPEAIALLKQKLQDYISNPIVNLRIINYKITILGEVRNPGTYTIPNERVSILEALGLSGDLNITAVRKNILVVREINGEKKSYRVDITSSSILESPVYYLKQNDIVYVEPNKTKINSSRNSATTSIVISAVSLLITVLSILTRN